MLVVGLLHFTNSLHASAKFATGDWISSINTDKAAYNTSSTVNFTVALKQQQSGLSLEVKYYHLNSVVAQQTVNVSGNTINWSWTTPSQDYKGYLVSAVLKNGDAILDQTTIGIDVSSNWKKFPRYGFLSKFGNLSDYAMDTVITKLNRYHINGIQFYDWMDKHHKPLAGTAENPSATWYDLANRLSYFESVKGYIDRAHNHNMKAMFYNLLYGSYPDPVAADDGVSETWGLYKNTNHSERYYNGGFPSSWEAGGLNIQDPGNSDWRTYLFNEHNKVYNARYLNFDGWHVDQLGDPGSVYKYNGTQVYLDQEYGSFLSAAKEARNDKLLVMNAVNQFGQSSIADAPVEFLYTEVWAGNENYSNLGGLIQQNLGYKSTFNTVLAAYVNKGKADSGQDGIFNDASVLMTDAVIFAFGGSHIELGEHMLGSEYFPNERLKMSTQLTKELTAYYDFSVAYENILRDGRTFNDVTLSGGDNVRYWPPVKGKVATVGTQWEGKQVFQVLNYVNAASLDWRDNDQAQPVPTVINNLALQFPYSSTVNKMWVASPDFNQGLPQEITFTQNNGTVSFQLPQLKYWSMVVVEPSTPTGLKVYFKKPAAWANANIHFWNTLPTGSSTNWPGNAMTAAPEVGSDWYSYTFNTGITSANIVFNNNGDNSTKTADLFRDATGYYDYSTSTWSATAPNARMANTPEVTDQTTLEQNVPNPFREKTAISYNLARKDRIRLSLYDDQGREISTLVNAVVEAGKHTVVVNGGALKPGLYCCVLVTGDQIKSTKLVKTP